MNVLYLYNSFRPYYLGAPKSSLNPAVVVQTTQNIELEVSGMQNPFQTINS